MQTFLKLLLCFFVALPCSAQRFVKIVGNTNELMAQPAPDVHTVTLMKGYASSNENLVLQFQHFPTSTATPDGLTIFRPTFGGMVGRYHLMTTISATNMFVLTNAVPGIGASTDNAIVRWDGTTGRLLQDSIGILSDAGVLSGITTLGVGTASPSYLIHAVKNSSSGSSTSNPTITVQNSNPTLEDGVTTFNISNLRMIAGNGIVDTRVMSVYDSLYAGARFGTVSAHPIQFFINNIANPKMTIDTSGRVGIGTTNPAATLHVVGDALITGGLTNSPLTASNIVFTDANKRLISGAVGSGLTWNGSSLVATGLGGTVTSIAATAPAAGFTISGSPITGSGTFGFLLTNDLAAVEGLSTTGIVQRTAADTWSTTLGAPGYLPLWSATTPFLTTTGMVFDTGTSVGIGTTNPVLGTLTVSGVGGVSGVRLGLFDSDTASGGHDWYFVNGGNFAFPQFVPGSLYIRDRTVGLNRMTFTTNGYVGIGTILGPPETILDVMDTLGTGIRIRRETFGALPDVRMVSSTAGVIGTFSAHPMSIWANSLEWLTVLTGGNVGIGTTTPGQKLTVAGEGRFGADAGPAVVLGVNSAAAATRDLNFYTAGTRRWSLRANATAEGGSSAGSNFEIIPSDDAGAALAAAVTITRASGNVTIPGAITNGALTASLPVFTDANKRLINTGLVPMTSGGTGVSLSDPGADKLFGWDDTGNTLQFMNIGAGLVYNAATDTLSSTNTGVAGGDFVGPASATDEAVVRFDGVTGKLGQNSVVIISDAGAVTGVATLNTGQGAYELYAMDQDVLTTSAPTFVTVNTGQGANELFDMDQNVQTTDTVTFGNLTVTTGITNLSLFASGPVFTDANKRLVNTGTMPLGQGGTAAVLSDPGANRLWGWDDTENAIKFFILGAGLSYDQATDTISATTTGGDVVGPASATDEAIARFDGTTGKLIQNSAATLSDAGAIAGVTTLNTGNGANELFPMDQAVLTTSAPTFLTVNTGQGANELYPMDQAVRTSDSPSFVGVTLTGSPSTVVTLNDFLVAPAGSSLIRLDAAGTGYTSIESAALVTGGLTNSALTASKPVFTDANKRLVSTGTLGLDQGGTGNSLSDPAANRLLGWDDTDNLTKFLTIGTGLSYDAATDTLSSTGLGGTVTGPGTIGRLPKWTGTTALGDSIISESSQILTLNGGASTFKTSSGTLTMQGAGQDLVTLGNVGIGTATPASLLNLAGTSPELLIRGTANAFQTFRGDGNTADSRLFGIGAGPAVGTDALVVSSYLDSGSGKNPNILVLQSGGNVGIATAAPAAKLHVTGDASISGSITNGGLTASKPVFTDANKKLVSTGTLALDQGGTQTSMADPNANRIMGWDDTENAVKFMVIGTGLSYNTGTDTLTASGGAAFGDANEIQYNDGADGFAASAGLTFDSGDFSLKIGTTGSPGILRIGADAAFHNFGLDNIFGGDSAGNFTLTGARDTAFGDSSLQSLTSGGDNTAVGHSSLGNVTTGNQNTAIGSFAGNSISTGQSNTLIGAASSLNAATDVHEIVIGSAVAGKGSHTATIGGVGTDGVRLNVNAGQATAKRVTVGGTIHVDTTTVGNVGAGVDDLMTFTLPGGTFAANHDRLIIRASGSYANTSAKDVAYSVAGVNIFQAVGATASGRWNYTLELFRTSATTFAFHNVYIDSLLGAVPLDGTGTATFSGDVIFKHTASATSDNDVTQKTLSIEWHPAPL